METERQSPESVEPSSVPLVPCRSSLSDFPEADVIWNRASLGRPEIHTPTPSVDGRASVVSVGPAGPKYYATYKEKEVMAWRCICGLEGYIGDWESDVKSTEELIQVTANLVRHRITTDPQKFPCRVKRLAKVIKSPNAFHQRSLERVVSLVLGAGISMDRETEAILKTHAQTLSRMKIYLGFLGTLLLVGIGVALYALFH